MFKKTFILVFGIVLAAQLTGCFFEDRDHRGYDHHEDHHEYHHDDAGVDVHLHG